MTPNVRAAAANSLTADRGQIAGDAVQGGGLAAGQAQHGRAGPGPVEGVQDRAETEGLVIGVSHHRQHGAPRRQPRRRRPRIRIGAASFTSRDRRDHGRPAGKIRARVGSPIPTQVYRVGTGRAQRPPWPRTSSAVRGRGTAGIRPRPGNDEDGQDPERASSGVRGGIGVRWWAGDWCRPDPGRTELVSTGRCTRRKSLRRRGFRFLGPVPSAV